MASELDSNSAVPLYKQVADIIVDKINEGVYKTGDKIPPEMSLMEAYGVSRITVRAAISALVDEGLLSRVQGKGTFVAKAKNIYSARDNVGFTRSCILSGCKPSSKVIKSEIVSASPKQIDFFNIGNGDKVICTERLRFIDGEPAMVETNYYPMSMKFILNENLEGSLFELLTNKYGYIISNSIRTIEICYSSEEEMKLLNLKEKQALLLFRDKHKDNNNKPLFLSKQVYCSGKFKFYL